MSNRNEVLTQAQEKLLTVEAKMRTLDPTSDTYWRLKPERTTLREATDLRWRDAHGFGTRASRWAPLPWPEDTKARWRVLREFIDAYHGVNVGDVASAKHRSASLQQYRKANRKPGSSVRQWSALVDELDAKKANVFRDDPHPHSVRGVFLSAMTQGEDDYLWAIHKDALANDDPPVVGFVRNVETGVFVPEQGTRPYGPYGSYERLTDCIRAHLNGYLRAVNFPFDEQLSHGMPVNLTSPAGASYEWTFTGVWATPLAARVSSAELLPAGWDQTLSDEVRDAVLLNFALHSLEDVTNDEPLGAAWELDDDELQEYVTDSLNEAALDLECDVDLDPNGKKLRTRAQIMEFVRKRLVEQNEP